MYFYLIEIDSNYKVGSTNFEWNRLKKYYEDPIKHLFFKNPRSKNIAYLTRKTFKKDGNYIKGKLGDILQAINTYKSISKLSKKELIEIADKLNITIDKTALKKDILEVIKSIDE